MNCGMYSRKKSMAIQLEKIRTTIQINFIAICSHSSDNACSCNPRDEIYMSSERRLWVS